MPFSSPISILCINQNTYFEFLITTRNFKGEEAPHHLKRSVKLGNYSKLDISPITVWSG